MIVATISPRWKQGLTTTTLLLAQAVAAATKLDVTLTYTGKDYGSLSDYTGLNLAEDKTRSTSQLIKLISTGALRSHELRDYAIKIQDNLHLLNTSSDNTSVADSEQLIRYIMQGSNDTGSLIFIEINTELFEDITQEILEIADLVIVVGDQSRQTANKYKDWLDNPELAPDKSKTCLVISSFQDVIMSSRDTAKMYNMQYKRVSRISYNPYIAKFANEERLTEVFDYILEKHSNVYRLHADMFDCSKLIGNNIGFRTDWRDQS